VLVQQRGRLARFRRRRWRQSCGGLGAGYSHGGESVG
jgi:hypothetical protein